MREDFTDLWPALAAIAVIVLFVWVASCVPERPADLKADAKQQLHISEFQLQDGTHCVTTWRGQAISCDWRAP